MSSQNNAYKERILGIYLFTKIGCFGYQRDSVFSPTLKTKIEVYTNKAKSILNVKSLKSQTSPLHYSISDINRKVVLKGASNEQFRNQYSIPSSGCVYFQTIQCLFHKYLFRKNDNELTP